MPRLAASFTEAAQSPPWRGRQAGVKYFPMRIFVSVASYCDPLLAFTLRGAVAAAADPARLHFGVVDQALADAPAVAHPGGGARLTCLRLDALQARGPCWARALAMTLADGEDWYLQIDSHMLFEAGWDERLVQQALALGAPRRRVALSTYPDAFRFEGGAPVAPAHAGGVLAQVVKAGTGFAADHPVLTFEARRVAGTEPVAAFHLGAGCLFAPGALVQEAPYDPWLYFHGEEQALALRLYTRGWDLFHPPALPLHHLYNEPGSGAPARPLHWDEAHDAQRAQAWWTLEQRSRQRLAALVRGEDLGIYGLGSARSLADYAAFSGIDYAAREIAPRAYAPAGPVL